MKMTVCCGILHRLPTSGQALDLFIPLQAVCADQCPNCMVDCCGGENGIY